MQETLDSAKRSVEEENASLLVTTNNNAEEIRTLELEIAIAKKDVCFFILCKVLIPLNQ